MSSIINFVSDIFSLVVGYPAFQLTNLIDKICANIGLPLSDKVKCYVSLVSVMTVIMSIIIASYKTTSYLEKKIGKGIVMDISIVRKD